MDVSVTTEPYVGARALWRSENLREIFVTFADPEAIGLSAVAGLLRPVGRREPHGLRVELQPPARPPPCCGRRLRRTDRTDRRAAP